MESRKQGQIIHSDTKSVVRQLIKKCDEEARSGQLLHNIRQANFRIAAYSGLSISSITKIRKQDLECGEEEKLPSPPNKKLRTSIVDCSEETKSVIKNVIYNFYIERKIVPSGPMLLAAIKEKTDFPWELHSLYRLLKNMGYKWRKSNNIRKILIEKPNIVMWRGKYLKAIDYYRRQNKNIVYIDETWVDNTLCFGKCWQSEDMLGVLKNTSSSHRYIIVHAGGEDGFVNGAELIFKANSTTGDYHGQMNSENFEKWLTQKLIPNLTKLNKTPTKNATKKQMIEWLLKNNVTHAESMRKFELYDLISKNKPDNKQFKADELLKLHGHNVLRLPPYMCELNPIELVWAQIKRTIKEKNVSTLSNEALQSTLDEAINVVTKENWKNYWNHIKKIEKEYWEKDSLMEDALDTLQGDEEYDSDTEKSTSEEDSE
nr:PREDICTED: uncharacterized protein LOC105662865 [Megachile rotundata]